MVCPATACCHCLPSLTALTPVTARPCPPPHLQGLLEILSSASEYDEVPVRSGEERVVQVRAGGRVAAGRQAAAHRCWMLQRELHGRAPLVHC